MRRILAGLALGLLLAVPAGYAGGRLVNVTTPMTQNLDAGGYSVVNAGQVSAQNVYATGNIVTDSTVDGGALLSRSGTLYLETPLQITVSGGTDDPSLGRRANTGSLYLRTAPAQVWLKTGDTDAGWTRVF